MDWVADNLHAWLDETSDAELDEMPDLADFFAAHELAARCGTATAPVNSCPSPPNAGTRRCT